MQNRKIEYNMEEIQTGLKRLIQTVEEVGVLVQQEEHGFSVTGSNLVFPYITVTLCLRGSGRAGYDMKEMTQYKNDLGIVLPGHIMRPIDCTADFEFTSMAISAKLLSDLKAYVFSHDYEKFHTEPLCHLTDIQAEQLQSIMEIINTIAQHPYDDLEHRRQMLISQLAVGYEFVNYYRKDQDEQWKTNHHTRLFSQFCDLVVMHYRESKDLQFYADRLGLHPKQLNKIVREATHGISPKGWIEQYVITQAKHLIESHPKQSLKHTAYALGFTEPSSFYRYFKHSTGMTAKEYSYLVAPPRAI